MAKRVPDPHPGLGLGQMSVEEYLRFEADAATKHEYVAGEVYAMSGVTLRHSQLVTNLMIRLRSATRGGPCPFGGSRRSEPT